MISNIIIIVIILLVLVYYYNNIVTKNELFNSTIHKINPMVCSNHMIWNKKGWTPQCYKGILTNHNVTPVKWLGYTHEYDCCV